MCQIVLKIIKFQIAVFFVAIFLEGNFFTCSVFAKEQSVEKIPSDNIYLFKYGGLQLYQSQEKDKKLTLGGEIITRYAYWNWFEAPADNNEYSYGFQRTRLHFKFESEYMNVFVQPQYVQMFGLPDDAVSPSPRGPLGMGGLYYLHNEERNPYKIGVHQAYVQFQNIFNQDILLKVGRFEYCDGLETLSKADGKKFNAVKKMRLADRLISSFGWSAFGRSFDGGLFSYDNDKINLTSSFFYPTQGGWEKDMDNTIEDIKISTVTLTAKREVLLPGAEIASFYYNYKDSRDVTQRVDNVSSVSADGVAIDIHMVGGHLLGVYDLGPGQLDILAWGGAQFGNWYELDHKAYAVSGEVGYQLTKAPWKPWLRMGYFIGSGDDNAGDSDHGTFFQMAPGTRKYQLLPFCDLMNTQDLFFQIITKPLKKLTLRTDYHFIWLTESEDKWYMGSGPTQEEGSVFGYLARPTNGEDALAQELDVILNYAVNPQLSLAFSYSHVFGKDVIKEIYGLDENADYVSLEMKLEF